jgi:hypothetical protein
MTVQPLGHQGTKPALASGSYGLRLGERDSVESDKVIAAGENQNLWNSGPNQPGLGQGKTMKVKVKDNPQRLNP